MEYCIDCAALSDAQTFHKCLAQTLALPDWYGHNLDALYDCLTELEAPVRLVLKHWDGEAVYAQGFRDVFLDAQEDNPDFEVCFS